MPPSLQSLRAQFPPDRISTAAALLAVHDADAQTSYRCRARAIVLPHTIDEVVSIVQWCHAEGVPFVVRGSGTGLCAGATPVPDGVVIVTTKLDRIITVDPSRRLALIESGVVNLDITRAAAPHQLHYAPDPSSQPICTIGGNVGFNAGGAHCLKHGMTSNHVLGLTAVLATGERVTWGSASRESIGPDWTGLFVGNEGLFGIALEVTVNLMPVAETRYTVLAGFASTAAAGDAVSAVIGAGMIPVAMELMDELTIEAVRPVVPLNYPPDCRAILVIELEGPAPIVAAQRPTLEALLTAQHATGLVVAYNDAERAAIWHVRKSAYSAFGRLAPSNMVQDCVVPRRHLGAALRRINEITTAANIRCANVCHAGDGNIHPNLLHDAAEPGAVEAVEHASGEILQACIALGGSITGEHGVGIEKKSYLPQMYGAAEMDLFRRIHAAFDPAGIANPGKTLESAPTLPTSPSDANPGPVPPSQSLLSAPTTIDELVAVVRTHVGPLLPVGRRTKPALSDHAAMLLPMDRLRGITDYAPEEFVLTALAGTPLADIAAELAQHGQGLPFDPPFVAAGATLGGAVASGLNGPRRFAHGGVRDAVLGMTLVDGRGLRLVVGARVVKNVAGFDLPKFMAGSLGRFGVLAEITIKVAPRPAAERTLVIDCDDAGELVTMLGQLARSPTEPHAIDARPLENRIYLRLAGPTEALEALSESISQTASGARPISDASASAWWSDVLGFGWAHADGTWLKVPTHLANLPRLIALLSESPAARLHVSAAGDLSYVSLPPHDTATREAMRQRGFDSLLLRGAGAVWHRTTPTAAIEPRIKAVLDPFNRFPTDLL
ncbi:FAD-binding oxidoreductase [Synoicihabitans lomoniglobus]|uniref:FAD-linked oxidase C-terminal domain-containing protein n=1 Tax=Synoicihabitans lomoniglobus TaxID=2909285 RepID=A0AAE9ZQF9_9BACT|nr:FAD-binding protein [Opitutaceae bacterium LMO-M01]WED63180.1 FAD-linked oxidase C-terminal domain-containing protein [Opitutaceae bacterium LMO-M01]